MAAAPTAIKGSIHAGCGAAGQASFRIVCHGDRGGLSLMPRTWLEDTHPPALVAREPDPLCCSARDHPPPALQYVQLRKRL